jgi:type IV pilus assembly protein PilN
VSARIPINLASEPFRRDRPMLVASAAFGIVLVALMGVLVFLILSERNRQTDSRAAVARLNAEARTLSDEQARLEGTLRLPMNAEVLERSLLLNTLIQHKSISWTKMFADIESVKPDNVKIIQVRLPQVNARNQVTLDMEVGAQNPAAAIELLKRLEESPLFGPTNLSRSAPPTQNEPLYRYRVVVSYAQKL